MPATTEAAASPSRSWTRLAGFILIGLLVAFAAWLLIRSDALRTSAHGRNTHELDIAAQVLESWPGSVRAMAVGSLLPSRIDPTHPAEIEKGWQKAARFRHPRLGTIYIHYGLPKAGICPEADAATGTAGNIRFDKDRSRLRIAGSLGTSDLWYADQFARADGGSIRTLSSDEANRFIGALGMAPGGDTARICFKAELPLAEVVDLPGTAPELEKLLILDRSGNLLAQVGGSPLPMASVDELSRLRPIFDSVIDAAQIAASQGKAVPKPREAGPVVDLSAPVEVSIGGDSYVAYARSLNLPEEFPALACKAITPAQGATENGQPTAAASGQTAKVRSCLVLGLVPTAKVNSASLRLSPAGLTGFALLLGLLVALLPVLKLRLIGPGDALRRVEVAAIALGLVTAIAIGTLSLFFAAAHITDNQRARARAQQIAAGMAADFDAELKAALNAPLAVVRIPADIDRFTIVEPAAPAGLLCRRPNGAAVQPLLVRDAGKQPLFTSQSGEGWWPITESSALFGEFGAAWPGFVPVLNRCDRGTRANIAGRAYFRAVMDGSPGDGKFDKTRDLRLPGLEIGRNYRVAVVRAQPDGIEKVIIAAPFTRAATDRTPGPQRGAFVETFVARTFVAPVLPAPFDFRVVNADDPAMTVLFASNPSRIEVDRFAEDIGSQDAIAAIRLARCHKEKHVCGAQARSFSATHDGTRQHFIAQGLKGTPWVLLVHYPADAIARPIAEAAVFAAGAWTGLALVVIVVLMLMAARRGPGLWHWSWPRPGGGTAYRRATGRVLMVFAGAAVLCLGLAAFPGIYSGLLAILIALAAPIAAVVLTVRTLARHRDDRARFLDPFDEAAFRNLAIALLLLIGALPMAVLWGDSRASSQAASDAAQAAHLDKAVAGNVQTRKTLMRAFGTDYPGAVSPAGTPAPARNGTGLYARFAIDLHDANATLAGPLTRNLRLWSDVEAGEARPACTFDEEAEPMSRDARAVLCDPEIPAVHNAAKNDFAVDIAAFRWFCFALLTGGIAAILLGAIGVVLRCLFGHGIPLEAVNYPGISRRSDGRLDLPTKALILNAPLALRLELLESWQTIDLSDPVPVTPDPANPRLLVTGLALALRDKELRAKALTALEHMARAIDAAERAGATAAIPDQIVVMTDLSPLDRILQAYESEQAQAGGTLPEEGRREQLRWSRLFEAFATIGFTPSTKVSSATADDPAFGGHPVNQREGMATLVNEIRDLPEVVIDSLISCPEEAVAGYWRRHTRAGGYPFDPALFTRFYDARVREWAGSVCPASPAAAVDYLRGTLIEHYQYAWIASSHAERVILDSLARGRTVNIANALALRSLVRRGLVRFAPVPRLLNESFAAFVLQAEKPMQINHWRSEQPRSLWQRSSLPLMILIPAAIIALMAVALYSGERAIGLMPLLLGSAPALIGTLGAIRRNSG
jgi:hypothetical protein